jgi:hypothetical protein
MSSSGIEPATFRLVAKYTIRNTLCAKWVHRAQDQWRAFFECGNEYSTKVPQKERNDMTERLQLYIMGCVSYLRAELARTVFSTHTGCWNHVTSGSHYLARPSISWVSDARFAWAAVARSVLLPSVQLDFYLILIKSLQRAVITVPICSTCFNVKGTHLAHSLSLCFTWLCEQNAISSLTRIKRLMFLTQMQCIFCEVRTSVLNIL